MEERQRKKTSPVLVLLRQSTFSRTPILLEM
jgi:hypothetical protein